MNGYTAVVALHVIVAVLGTGQIGAIAISTYAARRAGLSLTQIRSWLQPLLTTSRASLVLLLLSGIVLDAMLNGAYHHTWWFRISGLLLIGMGVAHGWARSSLVKGERGEIDGSFALRRVERTGWAMSCVVALIATLMEVKPF